MSRVTLETLENHLKLLILDLERLVRSFEFFVFARLRQFIPLSADDRRFLFQASNPYPNFFATTQ